QSQRIPSASASAIQYQKVSILSSQVMVTLLHWPRPRRAPIPCHLAHELVGRDDPRLPPAAESVAIGEHLLQTATMGEPERRCEVLAEPDPRRVEIVEKFHVKFFHCCLLE